jgi:hypothetical protein
MDRRLYDSLRASGWGKLNAITVSLHGPWFFLLALAVGGVITAAMYLLMKWMYP